MATTSSTNHHVGGQSPTNVMSSQAPVSAAPPPPPPPPPPMPHESQPSLPIDLVSPISIKPHMKMRTLNWRKIPKNKVLSHQLKLVDAHIGNEDPSRDEDDEDNIWFLIAKANKSVKRTANQNQSQQQQEPNGTKSASRIKEMLESVRRRMAAVSLTSDQNHQNQAQSDKSQTNIIEVIDFGQLERLFCLENQPLDGQLDHESPNFVRRSSLRTNASTDSAISSNFCIDEDAGDLSFEDENILDSRKSLNVTIFLKQLKSTTDDLVNKINQDNHSVLGKEKLESLLKLLPNEQEKTQLMKFYIRNRQHRLPQAERFLLQLITEVPNLRLRIKFMLLQESYRTELSAIAPDLDKIDKAVQEIRASNMLRDMLNLVLVTGNFLNTGSYATDAAGFSLDCLERLGEVRSNKPGVQLIHYLAELAHKLKLEEFLGKELGHVECASRVCLESIKLDLNSMVDKINQLKRETEQESQSGACDSRRFLMDLLSTLDTIKADVEFLQKRRFMLDETRRQLANYLCEDPDTFKLNECFRQLLNFSQKLKLAHDENERRRKAASRYENHHLQRPSGGSNLRRSNTINLRGGTGKPSGGRHSTGATETGQHLLYVRPAGATSPTRSYLVGLNNHGDCLSIGGGSGLNNNNNKRSSFGYNFDSSSSITSLSRTTSSFNVSETGSSSNNSANSNNGSRQNIHFSGNQASDGDFDELHDGLFRLLEDQTSRTHNHHRRSSIDSLARNKSVQKTAFGTYRRLSSLHNGPKPSHLL